MSIREELKRLEEARDKGAISEATYAKLRAQITDLVEEAETVASAPKPQPPKPQPPKPKSARPQSAYSEATSRHRAATARTGEVVDEQTEALPKQQHTPRNLWRDAALAGLVVVSGILTAGWLLGDVILALTIVLALLCLALIPIARRLVEEEQAEDALPPEEEQIET